MVKCVQNTMVNVFFQCTVDNFFTSVHSGKTYFQCTVVKCALAVKKKKQLGQLLLEVISNKLDFNRFLTVPSLQKTKWRPNKCHKFELISIDLRLYLTWE